VVSIGFTYRVGIAALPARPDASVDWPDWI
jgi:hypothetical protein